MNPGAGAASPRSSSVARPSETVMYAKNAKGHDPKDDSVDPSRIGEELTSANPSTDTSKKDESSPSVNTAQTNDVILVRIPGLRRKAQ